MKRSLLTLILAVVALTAGVALIIRGPAVQIHPAASVLDAGSRASVAARWRTRVDTVRRGEPLLAVLQRAGVGREDAAKALQSAPGFDARRVQPGTMITTRRNADSTTAEIVLQLGIDRWLHLNRSAPNVWAGTEERLAWTTDTVALAATVRSTLTEAIARSAAVFPAGVRTEVAYAIADILEYRVDLTRDLQVGDTIRVLLERQRAPNGLVRPGSILAARLTVDGRRVEAIRFTGRTARAQYFDADGKSMRAAFLRAPLAFRRISSVFGLRKHPILGIWRAHQGTDYSAASGTPVRALGDGTVIYAGWKGGYGRVVEIRHRNGFVTRYGHLRGFGAGIRAGASVAISRTIGFVGASGLATAPHLHFEVLVGGKHRDPRVALRSVTGEPLAGDDRPAFTALRSRLFARLDSVATGGAFVAQQPAPTVQREPARRGADN